MDVGDDGARRRQGSSAAAAAAVFRRCGNGLQEWVGEGAVRGCGGK